MASVLRKRVECGAGGQGIMGVAKDRSQMPAAGFGAALDLYQCYEDDFDWIMLENGVVALINIDRATWATIKAPIVELRYTSDQIVYQHGAPAQFVYVVDKGALFRFQLHSDDRRSIREFLLPGDGFGLEIDRNHRDTVRTFLLPGDGFGLEIDRNHRDTVRTLRPTRLLATTRDALLNAATTNCAFAKLLVNAAARSAIVAEQQGHRLRAMFPTEQVAQFLLDMESRLSIEGKFNLPMSRRHIADHFGITLETVSQY